MKLDDVRKKYLTFFEERGHATVPSASLVPDNDPTTLFTGSGMQPMLPFLLGEKHPLGTRIADSQKCFRAEDIEEVGDNRHTTFFEMLGNWSLGEYFKEEQLSWCFEFLVDVLELPPERLYITVFSGEEELGLERDTDSARIWQELFSKRGIEASTAEPVTEEGAAEMGMEAGARIFFYNAKKNWWSRAGSPGQMPSGEPGGPDSEVFYEFTDVPHDPAYGEHCHPNCDCGRFLEIGNSVFMEYIKKEDGTFGALPQKNVDFGGGLERLTAATIDNADIFKTNVFSSVIATLEEHSGRSYEEKEYQQSFRLVADHLRGAVFMISDGVVPSNTEAGYFSRRLIRRSVRHMDKLGVTEKGLASLVAPFVDLYSEAYPDLVRQREYIERIIREEEEKFRRTLEKGVREFDRISETEISGTQAFTLFTTYGLPIDMTVELAEEAGKHVDVDAFEKELERHKELSRAGAEKKFKGGLESTGEQEVRYHTATHLLNAALREVLGTHVEQRGSNITAERMRFDFSHPEKLTPEEKAAIEERVNSKIQEDLPVSWEEMDLEDAYESGAIGVFGESYSDRVKVYSIGNEETGVFSKEICGGPHVERTGELGTFRIKKEESVASGVRRIKAVLE